MPSEPNGVPDEAAQSRVAPMDEPASARLGARAIAFILLMAVAVLAIGWLVTGR